MTGRRPLLRRQLPRAVCRKGGEKLHWCGGAGSGLWFVTNYYYYVVNRDKAGYNCKSK